MLPDVQAEPDDRLLYDLPTDVRRILAAAYGYRDFADLLLQNGADKNIKDHTGQTPRHWAARYGKKELISLLK